MLDLRFDGDPVLRARAAPVVKFDDAIARLVADMFDTMYAAPGRGIAAPQVGVSQRIFVTDVTWKDAVPTPIAFVNPAVVDQSEDRQTGAEGCLSIPGLLFDVARPTWVVMNWQDIDGTPHQARFDGMQAICACHELDHLNGVLITDTGTQI